MCDYVSGELILCFPKVDSTARQLIEDIRKGLIEHVSYVESLEQKLARLGLKPNDDLEFEFHRVRVPVGEEQWKITYLQFFYKMKLADAIFHGQLAAASFATFRRSDYQFTVVPNSVLSLATKPLGEADVQAANFTFSEFHARYKATVRIPAEPPPDLDQVTIVIIDSGIADHVDDVDFDIADKRNFVDSGQLQEEIDEQEVDEQDVKKEREQIAEEGVTDENGHGTVIAMILHDLAPGSHLIIYKVADADGVAREWDTLAALATCAQAQVVNLSLQFGLRAHDCPVCGRKSHSSRSAVFENLIAQFAGRPQQPVLVAAAGNHRSRNLAFPARFSETLAIGAINSKGELSAESNYGNQYNDPDKPDNRFVTPGGDDTTDPPETIGSFGLNDDLHWHGTSFAAAYASGIVANLIAQQDEENVQYAAILNKLRKNADSKSDPKKFGHGIMRLFS